MVHWKQKANSVQSAVSEIIYVHTNMLKKKHIIYTGNWCAEINSKQIV